MAQVLILVDADPQSERVASSRLVRGIDALQQAIAADAFVQIVSAAEAPAIAALDTIVCPLTLAVSERLSFAGQQVFQSCRDVLSLRDAIAQKWNYLTGDGDHWLPIVLTAKGPLYAEVIGVADGEYYQPLHLPDRWRQPLYHLGQQLLQFLSAPPAVYLMQFGFQGDRVCFDRLLPFPDAPAIASLGVQTPNLYECHWRCLTGQPIVDLAISTPVAYQIHDSVASTATA